MTVAVVTGATRGIGQATSLILVLEGFDVVGIARGAATVQNDHLDGTTNTVPVMRADVGVFDEIVDVFGQIRRDWRSSLALCSRSLRVQRRHGFSQKHRDNHGNKPIGVLSWRSC